MTSAPMTAHDTTTPDAAVEQLVPAVTDLVRRVAGVAPRTTRVSPGHARVAAEILFPDGIGRGAVVVAVFCYRGAMRVDVTIEHNRVFAGRGGHPSGNRCYLNDYMASVTLALAETQLPVEFVRKVVAGVAAARSAVERRRRNSGWFQPEITTARPVFVPRGTPAGRLPSGS